MDFMREFPPTALMMPLLSVLVLVALFYRKKKPLVVSGILSLGFFIWGLYLGSYPFLHKQPYNVGFFVASALQLFIAVSMIVLALKDARHADKQFRAEINAVRSENEALQSRVLTTEEKCRNLYNQVRLTEGVQKAYDELRRTQHPENGCGSGKAGGRVERPAIGVPRVNGRAMGAVRPLAT